MTDLVSIGRVVKAKGLRGQVKVVVYSGQDACLKGGNKLFAGDKEGMIKALTPFRVWDEKGGFSVQFEEIKSREEAAALVGSTLLMEKNSLAELPEGEYYWFQLIGLTVSTSDGEILGTITKIWPTGEHDVLVVQKGKRELLLPAIPEVVMEVDLAKGEILVALPEGLLNLQ